MFMDIYARLCTFICPSGYDIWPSPPLGLPRSLPRPLSRVPALFLPLGLLLAVVPRVLPVVGDVPGELPVVGVVVAVAPVVPVMGSVVGEPAAVGVVPAAPLALSVSLEFLAPLGLCLASWAVVTCYLVCVALLRLLPAQLHTALPLSSVLRLALPRLQHALHHTA